MNHNLFRPTCNVYSKVLLFFVFSVTGGSKVSFIVSFFLSPVEQLSFHPAVMMMEMMTKPKCFLAISVVSQLVQFFIHFKTQLEKFVAIRCRQLAGRRRENEKKTGGPYCKLFFLLCLRRRRQLNWLKTRWV